MENNVINIVQTPVNTTAPEVEIIQPLVVNYEAEVTQPYEILPGDDIYIKDLHTGIFKLTYEGTKNIYYDTYDAADEKYISVVQDSSLLLYCSDDSTGRCWNFIDVVSGKFKIYYGHTNLTTEVGNAYTFESDDFTDYVKISDIIDNLTSQIANKPLSANQGYALKGLIDTINGKIPVTASSSNKLVDKAQADSTYVERDKNETCEYAVYVQYYNNGSYSDIVRELKVSPDNSTVPMRNTRGEIIVPNTTYSDAAISYGQAMSTFVQSLKTVGNSDIRVYVSYVSGTRLDTTLKAESATPQGATIVIRNTNGEIMTATGTTNDSAVNKAQMEAYVAAQVSAVYRYKGSVATYDDLPSSDLSIGDVYNVEDTGDNYAWTGTAWDQLAGVIDLSGYYTKVETDALLNGKVPTSRTIAGIALSGNISADDLIAQLFTVTEVTV